MSGGWWMLSPCHLVGDHQRSGPAVTVRTLCHSGSWPPTLTLATRRAGTELRKLYFVIVLPVKRSLRLTSNSFKSSLHNFTYYSSSHPLTSVLPWSGTQIKGGSYAQGKLYLYAEKCPSDFTLLVFTCCCCWGLLLCCCSCCCGQATALLGFLCWSWHHRSSGGHPLSRIITSQHL